MWLDSREYNMARSHRAGADPGGPITEGGAKIFGVFHVKNHDFTSKNHIFSNFRGARAGCTPPPWYRACHMLDELGNNPSESTWHKWIQKWSPLSLEDFLRSDFNQAIDQPKLRPWPEPAIEAYMVLLSFLPLPYVIVFFLY
jgi:hypothetical protein